MGKSASGGQTDPGLNGQTDRGHGASYLNLFELSFIGGESVRTGAIESSWLPFQAARRGKGSILCGRGQKTIGCYANTGVAFIITVLLVN